MAECPLINYSYELHLTITNLLRKVSKLKFCAPESHLNIILLNHKYYSDKSPL